MARLLLLTVFALSVFGYGIGVGHYQWPPWHVLAAGFRAARLPSTMIEQSYVEAKADLFARSRVRPDIIQIRFFDLNAILADGEALDPRNSFDGLHLNARGYLIWNAALAPVLRDAVR
jgi:lysophospholipase L1-like esterase